MRELSAGRLTEGEKKQTAKLCLSSNYPSGASYHPLTAAVPLRAVRQNN